MADGTISIADGLGFKAIDSNEIRRKQRSVSDSPVCPSSHSTLQGKLSNSPPQGVESLSPKSNKATSPARKMQQVFFEERLIMEAEERAVQSKATQSSNHQIEVKTSNPTIRNNARGDPYVEGDPNLGDCSRSLKPRYSSDFLAGLTHSTTLMIEFDSKPVPTSPVNTGPPSFSQADPTPPQQQQPINRPHPQPNPRQTNFKPSGGFKPKNWASLL